MNPFFSIIIPCLNEEKYLPKLLSNLEKQNFNNFEVIVIDGKSEDKTVKVAQSFSKKININVITAEKRNASHQRNLGAKNSIGKYLIFFDADTKIPKQFLKIIYKVFSEENVDVINTWIKSPSYLESDKAIATGINMIFEITKFINSPGCFGAFLAIKKSSFNKIKGFNEKLTFAEDSEILQKAVKEGFSYKLLRNTYYYYSLRRFKKEGTLKTIRKVALLNLNRALNLEKFISLPEYSMGGHVFETKTKKQSLIWFENTIEKLRANVNLNTKTNKNYKKEFTDYLRKLFEDTNHQ